MDGSGDDNTVGDNGNANTVNDDVDVDESFPNIGSQDILAARRRHSVENNIGAVFLLGNLRGIIVTNKGLYKFHSCASCVERYGQLLLNANNLMID